MRPRFNDYIMVGADPGRKVSPGGESLTFLIVSLHPVRSLWPAGRRMVESDVDRNQRRRFLSWLAIGALFVFCGILGLLQYRWIGEVSIAERERLQANLQSTLAQLSADFNSEITAACRAVMPAEADLDGKNLETGIVFRYQQWAKLTRHSGLFRGLALMRREHDRLVLERLDPASAGFQPMEWPSAWEPLRERMEARFSREARETRTRPEAPPEFSPPRPDDPFSQQMPFLVMVSRRMPPGVFGPWKPEWLLFDLDPVYLRKALLNEVLERYLGSTGTMEYEAWVVSRTHPPEVIFRTDSAPAKPVTAAADASVYLFDLQYDQLFHHGANVLTQSRTAPPASARGRWQLFVRHRSGSLEAVVERARMRNLAVTGSVLLLMLATIGALIRFTRQSQKLAELQMDFVAGVSHELRTPLTVIHTAGYNLRGAVAGNPEQVERYGKLIQQESGRLKELVEQVLRFAGMQAGRVIRDLEPVSIDQVIEEALDSARSTVEAAHCVVEKNIEPGLPPILGDRIALKQAIRNLVENAAKYGAEGGRWIGMTASKTNGTNPPAVEIAVADRGPGIPADEQKLVFDPFFRGRRAVEDQIRGTGLGLNLVKRIVEAHGGVIRLKSEPAKGVAFIVRIPVAAERDAR